MSLTTTGRAAAMIAGLALGLAPGLGAQTRSYVRIDTPERKRSFHAEGGRAWVGKRVHLHLPARTLARAAKHSRTTDRLRYKGIEIRIGRSLPSYRRFLRRRAAKGHVCIKGQMHATKRDKKTSAVLRVHSVRSGRIRAWLP